MATQPTPMRPRREMQEVKAPAQFTFTKVGQISEGVLFRIEPVAVKGKQANEYMFMADSGARFTLLGTNDLDKKLHAGLIGCYVTIRYENDDNSFTKPGQNAMKIFKVEVSKEKEPGF
jgi:hypothetical protein